jgi:hypothetical protein
MSIATTVLEAEEAESGLAFAIEGAATIKIVKNLITEN